MPLLPSLSPVRRVPGRPVSGALVAALALVAAPLTSSAAPGGGAASETGLPSCDAPGLAPCNPHLAASAQSSTHGNNYRQSTYLGPTSATGGDLVAEHLFLDGVVPIWAHVSAPYPDGRRVVWLNVAGTNQVVKVDPDDLTVIAESPASAPRPGNGVAYYELNADNQLVRLNNSVLEAWGDADPEDPRSGVVRLAAFPVPPSLVCEGEDLVGLAHTYDGHLLIGTSRGSVLVFPADPARWDRGPVATSTVAPNPCEAGGETMSNNLTVDETGGIYLVTDRALYRWQWDGRSLAQVWRSTYASDTSGALGGGSGATPTLMGDPSQDDRFVVVTDASPLMRLNVYWRDEIPPGWEPPVGDDPRLACSVPVNFGDPTRSATKTDQSVTVDGYAAYVVDNTIRHLPELERMPLRARPVLTQLAGGMPRHTPRGAQRIDWDPVARQCRTTWGNPRVSYPNGIPMIARDQGLMIDGSLAVRGGRPVFGIRALDVRDGSTAWFVPGSQQRCGDRLAPLLSLLGVLAPDSPLDPDLRTVCENSNFAGATMDDEGRIYMPTSFGLSRYSVEREVSR